MWRFFTSMRFAFIAMICLIIWFAAGAFLTLAKIPGDVFKAMNHEMLIGWFFGTALASPLVMIWFVVFCLIAAMLMVSLLFCTYHTLYKSVKVKTRWRPVLLLVIHLNFILILIFHVITATTGIKQGQLELGPGDSYQHESGYSIQVTGIQYVDDLKCLEKSNKKSRRDMSFQNFSHRDNYATVALFYNGLLLSQGRAYVLKPFVYKDLRFTVEKFILTGKGEKREAGVLGILVKNPFIFPFFILYAIEVLLILIFAIASWKKDAV